MSQITLFPSLLEKAYAYKALSYAPVAYWKLNETGGTQAADSSGNGRNGTYVGGMTLANSAAAGQSMGNYPSFDGTSGYVNLYSAGLAAAFPYNAGSIVIWARHAVWSNASVAFMFDFRSTSSTDLISMFKNGSNAMQSLHRGNSTTVTVNSAASGAAHKCYVLTWSVAGNAMKFYIDNVQMGGTQTGLVNWAGVLNSANAQLAASTASGGAYWNGSLGDVALYSGVLPDAAIANLSIAA